ncbi:MAG: acylphosphatase [Chloroflexi bacterium]|nr:acylphosphatase [Chloroflexota bacterium]
MVKEGKQLRAVAHGKVQGVFFRAFVTRHARALGVTGYVSNLPDGHSIELCAEGPYAKLEELLRLFRSGPPGARVERVEKTWSEIAEGFANFEIRH